MSTPLVKVGDRLRRARYPTRRCNLDDIVEVQAVHVSRKDSVLVFVTFPGEANARWSNLNLYEPVNQTEESSVNPTTPKLPNMPFTVEQLEQMLIDARLRDQQAAEKAALAARLQYHKELAAATVELLGRLHIVLIGGHQSASRSADLVKFRSELLPLAELYGCTIIPVGDLSEATIAIKE